MRRHPLENVERRPHTCIWEITGACNLRCIHCANHSGKPGPRELPLEKMLLLVKSLAQLGCKMIDITGGEPLLHPHWDTLAKEIADHGMEAALITNGTLLDESCLDRAVRAGIQVIAISLDGLQVAHDRVRQGLGSGSSPFEKSVAAIKGSLQRVKTRVITQVNLYNLPQLRQLRAFLGQMGVQSWQLQLAVPTGRLLYSNAPYVISPNQLEELTDFIVEAALDGGPPFIDTSDTIGYYTAKESILRKRREGQGVWLGCQAGIRAMAITYNGTVRGCSLMPAEFDAGDLHSETLEEIWRQKKRFAFSTGFDCDRLTGACARCRFGFLCRAGCTTMAYWSTGTIYENPYCLSSRKEKTR